MAADMRSKNRMSPKATVSIFFASVKQFVLFGTYLDIIEVCFGCKYPIRTELNRVPYSGQLFSRISDLVDYGNFMHLILALL